MKNTPKISTTAYRVLYLTLLLSENSYNIKDLNKEFVKNPLIARSFTKEVILKYINTIKLANFEISKKTKKDNNKYVLDSLFKNIQLTRKEAKALILIEQYANDTHQENLKHTYDSFYEKLTKYLTEESKELLKEERINPENQNIIDYSEFETFSALVKEYEQYCIDAQRVCVKYHPLESDLQEFIIEPCSIRFTPKHIYFTGYNTVAGEKQIFYIKYIKELKQLPQRSKSSKIYSPVIFKLKNRIAKGYKPYEGEQIIETSASSITVASRLDDKNLLLQRLLRYAEYCEIISPKSIREKFISTIEKTLLNYADS